MPCPDVKKKLMKGKDCHCPPDSRMENMRQHRLLQTECRYEQCTLMKCPDCGMTAVEWGPVFCKHKNQWYRQLIYPEMAPEEHHFYPKGSTMRKRKQPRK